jgi:hypothetical protein
MSSHHKLAIVSAKAGAALAVLLLLLLGVTHLGFDFDFKLPWIAAAPPGPFFGDVPKLESRCRFKDLPPNFEYDAVGIYKGVRTDVPKDPRFKGAKFVGAVTVRVTTTRQPVVLLLTSYESTVWNIEAARGAEIVGIAFSGYKPSMVQGEIPEAVKPIGLTPDASCSHQGYSYGSAHSGADFRRLQGLAIALAGTRLSTFQGINDPSQVKGVPPFIVGPGATHLSDLSTIRAGLQRHSPFGPANEGIDKLIAQGALRAATGDEIFAWKSADPELAAYGLVREGEADYTILKPFTFPEGMYGAGSATFILPKGVPMPSGDIGHNTVLKMDDSDGCIAIEGAFGCRKVR